MITFGLLMSVYDGDDDKHLIQALKSCDYAPLEEVVIVVDGPVRKIIIDVIRSNVPHTKLRILQLEKNVGLGAALNAGLELAKSDFIFRFDSDDINVKSRFSDQIEFIKNNSVDILGGHIDEFDNDPEAVTGKRVVPLKHDDVRRQLMYRNSLNHVTVCFDRKKILSLGSYRSVMSHEDYDLWVRAVIAGLRITNLDQSLVLVRTGNGFLNRRHGLKYLLLECRFVRLNLSFFRFQAIPYLLIRLPLRLLPSTALRLVYATILRK